MEGVKEREEIKYKRKGQCRREGKGRKEER